MPIASIAATIAALRYSGAAYYHARLQF